MVLTRELTKVYEEILRGKVSEIRTQIGERLLKGEITLVVSGRLREKINRRHGEGASPCLPLPRPPGFI